jgi:predicted cobalt transporter CbtA
MLVGIIAGLLAFGFGKLFGEPQIERAIAFEEQTAAGHQAPVDKKDSHGQHSHGAAASQVQADEPEIVSRSVQSNAGFLTAAVIYSAAVGGLFSLVFAFAYGRVGPLGPRATAALLAAAAFLTIAIVPALKYPPNPPAVGDPDTIGYRTLLFYLILAISIAALTLAVVLRRRIVAVHGAWNASLIAGGFFVAVIAICLFVMPDFNETPDNFPANVLWRFRIASLGTQAVIWATIGLLFGALTERSLANRNVRGL